MRLGSGVSAVFLALWLLLAGCSSEEASNVPNEEETTSTETTTDEAPNPLRLTSLGGAGWPVFSPDGQKIAFFNQPTGIGLSNGMVPPLQPPYELYVMNSDGTNLTRLANQVGIPQANYQGVTFSPDGTKIAFIVGEGVRPGLADNVEIHVVDADGTNLNNLTNNPAYDSAPTWSPDGQAIAFESNRDFPRTEIYVMNSDGTNPTNLTNNVADHDRTPIFYPNGEQIAFTGAGASYVMDTDGSNPTRLTSSWDGRSPLRFSSDGGKIAFEGGGFDIYVMNPDGTDLTLVAEGDASLFPIFPPDFLPGEQKVVAKDNREGNDEIYLVNTDGTDPTNITNNASAHDTQPTFSPDGKKMAFVSQSYDESGRFVSEIYLMNLD